MSGTENNGRLRLVTVAHNIPDPATGGAGNWGTCLIRHFAKAGHHVTHLAVLGKHGSPSDLSRLQTSYRQLGIDLEVLPFPSEPPAPHGIAEKLRMLVRPRLEDLWPREMSVRPSVHRRIAELAPDCVVTFAFDAALYTHGLRSAPRVSMLTEGPHLNTHVNWKYDPAVEPGLSPAYLAYTARTMAAIRVQERLFASVVKDLTIAGFGGPHYVRWAESRGLTNAAFVTTPTPDPTNGRWRELRSGRAPGARCRILVIGHLYSTSNRSQLPLLFHEFLPALERMWGPDKFEIRMVGNNDRMPSRFDRWRSHPAVTWVGPVSDPTDEFASCDVLLVPVPAKTGSRVRIINGFTYGCCVVAHDANALGIPELVDGENCLLAGDGAGLARLTVRAHNDPDLRRRLGENGRAVYDRYYTEEAGGRQYLELARKAIALHSSRKT